MTKTKRQLRERIGRFFHDRLGWHEPDENGHVFDLNPSHFDIYGHATCRYCGKRIIPASDFGDWMVVEDD